MEDEEFGTLQELERSATIDYIRAIEAERDAAIKRAETAEAQNIELAQRLQMAQQDARELGAMIGAMDGYLEYCNGTSEPLTLPEWWLMQEEESTQQ